MAFVDCCSAAVIIFAFQGFSSEPLVQIQNNFTELFLMMASTKIAQMVQPGWIKGPPELLINNTSSRTTGPNSK